MLIVNLCLYSSENEEQGYINSSNVNKNFKKVDSDNIDDISNDLFQHPNKQISSFLDNNDDEDNDFDKLRYPKHKRMKNFLIYKMVTFPF